MNADGSILKTLSVLIRVHLWLFFSVVLCALCGEISSQDRIHNMTHMTDNPNKGKKLAVLGGGPGGYPAAFLAADLGFDVTLIDKEPKPGGVCLYRGCIPSKTMLHIAKLLTEAQEAADWGITFDKPKVDVAKLASFSQRVIAKLTGGLGALAKQRQVTMIQGAGTFADNSTLEVAKADGSTTKVTFDYCIIATALRRPDFRGFPMTATA
jgi:pyruvate/2-oxoglutarate dehydrogenase complex dihydrolipoamide dehydrogenase (E3) component